MKEIVRSLSNPESRAEIIGDFAAVFDAMGFEDAYDGEDDIGEFFSIFCEGEHFAVGFFSEARARNASVFAGVVGI